jgi:hypothetical protein
MTIVHLPDELVKRALASTGAPTADEAVAKVLGQLPDRPTGQKDLVRHLGTFEDFMTPEELHELRGRE